MRILSFTLGFIFFLSINTFGQLPPPGGGGGSGSTVNELIPEVNSITNVPQSPEVAAFEQYGNVPVSMYTGTAGVSIPIGVISGRETSMPVTLTHDGMGVKVEGQSTWVGYGWNMAVGGVVSRQVSGLPDGIMSGKNVLNNLGMINYLKNNYVVQNTYHPEQTLTDYFNLLKDNNDQKTDIQPDLFHVNVNGISGTIVIDYSTMTPYCIDNPKLKVEFVDVFPNSNEMNIISWKVIDENGTEYLFNKLEKTRHDYDGPGQQFSREYTSSWHLGSITSANRKDYITFQYFTDPYWSNDVYISRGPSTVSFSPGAGSGGNTCSTGLNYSHSPDNYYNIKQVYLSSVIVNGKTAASFIRDNIQRRDKPGSYRLKEIKLLNAHDGGQTQRAVLNHGYFGNQSYVNGGLSKEYNKLKLNSVSLYGNSNSSTPNVYSLEYENPNATPPNTSYAMDYWGYYNGQTSNSTLIPAQSINGTSLSGANRDPSLTHSKIGSLKKIHYPTGGHTEFNYSLNYAVPSTSSNNLSSTIEVSTGVINYTGGINPNNPYNYCDDGMVGYPEGDDGLFYIDRTINNAVPERLELRFNVSGSPAPGLQEVIIYRSGNGCVLVNGPNGPVNFCDTGVAQDYCELFNATNNPDIVYWQNFGATSTNTINVNISSWQDGTYRVLSINNSASVNVQVDYIEEQTINNSGSSGSLAARGGLRVVKTIDRTTSSTSSDAVTKYYFYDDLSKVTEPITESVLLSTSASSGIEHLPMSFHSLSSHTRPSWETPQVCESVIRHARNTRRSAGAGLAYSTVSEVTYKNGQFNGYSVYNFHNDSETVSPAPLPKAKLLNGETETVRVYDSEHNLLTKTVNSHSIVSDPAVYPLNSSGIQFNYNGTTRGIKIKHTNNFSTYAYFYMPWEVGGNNGSLWPPFCSSPNYDCAALDTWTDYDYTVINHIVRWKQTNGSISYQYYDTGDVITSSVHDYTHHVNPNWINLFPTKTTATTSDGDIVENIFYYANNSSQMSGVSVADKNLINDLYLKNQIGKVIRTERYRKDGPTNKLLFTQQTLFKNESNSRILEKSILTSKGSNALGERLVIHDYDEHGNAVEVSKADGTKVVMLYGYNHTLPIAQIINTTYADALSALGQSNLNYLQNYSDAQIRTEIDKIRNHSSMTNAHVTTYTHKPGIGMTSMEDPKGLIQYYYYDGHNRLEYVKDKDQKILSKNTYNLN